MGDQAEIGEEKRIKSLVSSVDLGEPMSKNRQAVALPVGTVTLLLADAEGSTRLWQDDPDSMGQAVSGHDRLVDEAIGRNGGVKPKDQGEGDSFMAAFSRPSDALMAALEIQRGLTGQESPIKLRIAIHTGEVHLRDESNYIGTAVNRTARLRGVGHGGQILLSQVTHDLVADRPPEGVSFKELGVHRLKDLSRPERVFQVLHPDLTTDFPPLRSLDALPNNLPAQRTTFIGRWNELAELKSLMASTRLLTLSGSGGSGKTRLALQLGADLLDEFDEGVWFVPLSSVTADDAVAPQTALAIGLGESQSELLPTFIGSKSMMLILDNAEHVVKGAGELASKLLDVCPNLRLLATSREPLSIEGETTYRVPSLSLPSERSRFPIEALTEYEAIQLFVDRAHRVRPNFKVDEGNAGVVADICRRLDGIPLAIELAASRIRVLSPSQILDGLADRFRLLTGSSRTAMPRQQTLRASVDWSYELLNADEQKVLQRLSAFPAAFDLDAAEAVASSDEVDRPLVLDLLTQLVDKSLVVASDAGASTRYSMLETIRQYAFDRLTDGDEEELVRLRHRDYYLSWWDREWDTAMAEGLDARHFATDELINCEAALEWTLQRSEEAAASKLFASGVAMAYFGGRDWLSKFLDPLLPLLEEDSIERGRVLASASTLASFRFELAPHVIEAVTILRTLPEAEASRYLPSALWGQAWVAMYMDRPKARGLFEETMSAAEKVGQKYWAVWGEAMAGYVRSLEGEVDEGISVMKSAIEKARPLSSSWLLGGVLFETGLAHILAGRSREALPYYEEAIPVMRELKIRLVFFQWALDHLSQILVEMERMDEARPYLEEAMTYSRDYDLERGNYWNVVENLSRVKWNDGLQEEALELQKKALEGYERENRPDPTVGALSRLSRMELRRGNREQARKLLDRALVLARDYELKMGMTGVAPVRRVDIPIRAAIFFSKAQSPAAAARLQGFVDGWRESNALRWNEYSERLERETIDELIASLGAKRVEEEMRPGRNLSMESAVAYALGETSDPVVAALLNADAAEQSIKAGSTFESTDLDASLEALEGAEFLIPRAVLALGSASQQLSWKLGEAEGLAHEALGILIEAEDPILLAICFELLAEIAGAHGSFEEAARLCGAALTLRESAGQASMPCITGKVREALGPDAFDAAIAEGMKMSAKQAAEYAARGRGERKRPSSGWESLTTTETQVADLVAEGLTNPQIAERLFVSKRTIQTHLYNMFSKLGVSSRAELAAEVARRRV